jgi:hypothetical protein
LLPVFLSHTNLSKTFQTPCHAMLTRKFNKQTRQFWARNIAASSEARRGNGVKGVKKELEARRTMRPNQ